MKTTLSHFVLAVLIAVTPATCFALRSIGILTRAEAKEMNIALRIVGDDPVQCWVELELRPEGKLKNFSHVELEIDEGNKSLLSYAALQQRKLDSGNIVVRFLTVRDFLDKITLTVVVAEPTEVGHMLRVKDFVEAKKAP